MLYIYIYIFHFILYIYYICINIYIYYTIFIFVSMNRIFSSRKLITFYPCFVYLSKLGESAGEETRWQLHKNAACNPQQVLAATPHKTPTVRPPAPYHENYSS